MNSIRKAVIPAAGYGTRMLPITKSVSKEMLPLVDKPILQVVVEELVDAGIDDIIIVTAAHKTDMVDYFTGTGGALIDHLRTAGPDKAGFISALGNVSNLANFAFIEQRGPYGTGTPVLNAEPYLGNEPFIYTYADDFMVSRNNSFRQVIEAYEEHGGPVLGCLELNGDDDYRRYGYVGGTEAGPGVLRMDQFVEKPGKEHAPSNLASLGWYVVTPDVVKALHAVRADASTNNELYFPEAFNIMIANGQPVFAKKIEGARYYDTGNTLEYMKTVVAMAARHPEIGTEFTRYLQEFIAEDVQ